MVLSQVADSSPGMYEGVRRQRGGMESSFLFCLSLLPPPLPFLSPDSKGLDVILAFRCYSERGLCQRASSLPSGASGIHDGCGDATAEHTCQRGAAGHGLLQVIPELYASLAEIT